MKRAQIKAGELYRMGDYYAADSPLAPGTVVRVLNPTGSTRDIPHDPVDGEISVSSWISGIVVVVEAELRAANLLTNPEATAPPEYNAPIKSLERLTTPTKPETPTAVTEPKTLNPRRGNRHVKHSQADNFAILVMEISAFTDGGGVDSLMTHTAEIHEYPEAIALATKLEGTLADLRRLALAVKDGPRVCENCGGPLGGRADARYCSASCRQQARRKRVQP